MNNSTLEHAGLRQIALSPSPIALIESLRSIGYTIETALADIVDNSISAEAFNIEVRFLWDEYTPWIAILDDGHGMSVDKLRAAMRFGSLSPREERAKNDLGRFGLGMKTASISQCRNLTVCSKAGGELSGCQWDLDRIAEKNSDEWLLSVLDDQAIAQDDHLNELATDYFKNKDSGTIVLWRHLDATMAGTDAIDGERKFSELMSGARSHLETVFHRFLSPNKGQKSVQMAFNNSELTAFNPFGPAIPARQEKQLEKITLYGETIKIQPYILPHPNKVSRSEYEKYAGEGGYLQNQGFYVYRNRRLIVKATWFRLIKKEELNKLVRVQIDIPNSLDHLWAINVHKSQVTPPEVVRKELKKIIQRISGAGKQVYRRKATKLQSRNLTPVWAREVVDGKISYAVNENHPLVNDLIQSVPSNIQGKVGSCLKLIAQSFPKDVYYNDIADDSVEIKIGNDDVDAVRGSCLQLISTLKACGFSGADLKRRVRQTEIPGVTESLIEELLNPES
jgi:hypothetical protein